MSSENGCTDSGLRKAETSRAVADLCDFCVCQVGESRQKIGWALLLLRSLYDQLQFASVTLPSASFLLTATTELRRTTSKSFSSRLLDSASHNREGALDDLTVISHPAKDSLEFHGPQGRDHNYVRVSGKVGNIKLHAHSSNPSEFTFDSTSIGSPIKTFCLKGTTAALQLSQLNEGAKIRMVALRNIDLKEATKGKYVINLLGIDLKA